MFCNSGLTLVHKWSISPQQCETRWKQPQSILHGHNSVPVIHSVLGHSTFSSICACTSAYTGAGLWTVATTHGLLRGTRPCLGSAWSLWLALGCLGSHQQEGRRAGHPRTSVPGALRASVCMCFHSLSLQAFIILINIEEVGVIKLYLREIFRIGLFSVMEPLTGFNTRLVINWFVYLFSVFVSTNKYHN